MKFKPGTIDAANLGAGLLNPSVDVALKNLIIDEEEYVNSGGPFVIGASTDFFNPSLVDASIGDILMIQSSWRGQKGGTNGAVHFSYWGDGASAIFDGITSAPFNWDLFNATVNAGLWTMAAITRFHICTGAGEINLSFTAHSDGSDLTIAQNDCRFWAALLRY